MINDEKERTEEVHKYLQLDLTKSTELQDIVDLAAQLCHKPIAIITLLDEHLNWLKVRSGVDVEVMPRNTSFCQIGIKQDDILIIPDALEDDRFDENPLVHSHPYIRFYAGAPLALKNGLKLGALCLFDLKPGNLTSLQKRALTILSRQVAFFLELEMARMQLEKLVEETQAKNESLMKIAYIQSHDIRHPLTSIMGLVGLIKDNVQAVDADWLKLMTTAANNLDARIMAMVKESITDKDLRAIRFNKMVEEIEDYAILLLDQNGNIENWNKGAQLLKGYDSGEIIGKNFDIFYTAEDRKKGRPKRLIAHAIKYGTARDEGFRVRKNGTKFWGSIVITAIHNEKDEVIGFTKVTKNLTDKIKPTLGI